jgi:hypothetical protein
MDPKENVVPADDANAEQAALQDIAESDLRNTVITALGIEDNDANKSIIDKAVEMKKSDTALLRTAIRQKQTWRDKANGGGKGHGSKQGVGDMSPEELDAYIDKRAGDRAGEDKLKALTDVSDEAKAEIRDYAKVKNIGLADALNTGVAKAIIGDAQKAYRIKAAATNGGKSVTVGSIDPSKPLNPRDFNLSTKEGRDDWNAAVKAKRATS